MTAEWKKKPLERGKRYSDIQRLQARVKELEVALQDTADLYRLKKDELAHVTKIAKDRIDASDKYNTLRRNGVMIEDEGQFKYLKGDELDEFMRNYRSEPFFTFDEVAAVDWQMVYGNRIRNEGMKTVSGYVTYDGTWYRFHAEP
jgi:uncharacterized protein YcbK (DUF882 family)